MLEEKRALTIRSTADRALVAQWLSNAPDGTHVSFVPTKRSLEQNARLHAMIGELSKKATHHGQRLDIRAWKILFMEAFGVEQKLVPTLDGKGVVPLGWQTSQLTIPQCSDLMEFISAWAAENGIELTDPRYGSHAA